MTVSLSVSGATGASPIEGSKVSMVASCRYASVESYIRHVSTKILSGKRSAMRVSRYGIGWGVGLEGIGEVVVSPESFKAFVCIYQRYIEQEHKPKVEFDDVVKRAIGYRAGYSWESIDPLMTTREAACLVGMAELLNDEGVQDSCGLLSLDEFPIADEYNKRNGDLDLYTPRGVLRHMKSKYGSLDEATDARKFAEGCSKLLEGHLPGSDPVSLSSAVRSLFSQWSADSWSEASSL